VGPPVSEKLEPSSSDDGDGSGASVPQVKLQQTLITKFMAQPLIALFIYLSSLGFLDGLQKVIQVRGTLILLKDS
jgi:hypothetical protein